MAWTGTATVTSLGKNVVRITGVSLAAGDSGTIGLSGGNGNISLPSSFPSASDSASLTMSDLVEVRFQRGNSGGQEATHLHTAKADSPFLITFSNDLQQPSGPLDIYVQYFHTAIR